MSRKNIPDTLRATVLLVDTPLPSGRVYDCAMVQDAIDDFMRGPRYGEYLSRKGDHDSVWQIRLEQVSHRVESLSIQEDGRVVADVKVIPDSQLGKIVKHEIEKYHLYLIDEPFPYGLSLRAVGKLNGNPDGTMEVGEYRIIAVDIIPYGDSLAVQLDPESCACPGIPKIVRMKSKGT